MSDFTNLVGLYLVVEGVFSIGLFREQPPIFQFGRLARVGIGAWLLLKD